MIEPESVSLPPDIERVAQQRLRDYFAAHVLAGLGTWSPLSYGLTHREPGFRATVMKARAELAYAQADAMLEARKR